MQVTLTNRAAPGADPASVINRLAVVRLMLQDFRCYDRLELALTGAPVVVVGANGAGKTNLLEAVSLLAPGRGLRRAKLSAMDRRPASAVGDAGVIGWPWTVAAFLDHPGGQVEIGTARTGAPDGGGRRIVKIQGVAQKGAASLSDYAAVLWLTPQMDGLFIEGAGERRRFIDRAVYGMDPSHAARVAAYEQAARERLQLLRQGRDDAAWLDGLERQMAEWGVAIAAARLDAVAQWNETMRDGWTVFPHARVAMAGTIEDWLEQMPAIAAEDQLAASLARTRSVDGMAGQTTIGPQRSDLQVFYAATGRPAADCSTGEQKALLIALVLAQAQMVQRRRAMVPLLLLDEVAAHLDLNRRAALFDFLTGLGAQVWLTGTDEPLFTGLRGRAQFLAVSQARISSM